MLRLNLKRREIPGRRLPLPDRTGAALALLALSGLALPADAASASPREPRPATAVVPVVTTTTDRIPSQVDRALSAMGTRFDERVFAADRPTALAASEAAAGEVARVESLLSTWRDDTPLARLAAAPVGSPVELPGELLAVLAEVQRLSARTDGRFSPTVLPLVRAWDLRGAGRWPSDDERQRALAASGPGAVDLDPAAGVAIRRHADAAFDEGGWGKGWGLDRAGEAALAAGATGALLDLGGQLLGVGIPPDAGGWSVDLADPRHRDRVVGTIRFGSGSVATSGNSERGLVADGRRIGHLLDPRTALPAIDFGSVTVVAPTALVADVLSTALFVAGPSEGPELSRRLRAAGLVHEALFLVAGPDGVAPVPTPGFPRFDAAASLGASTAVGEPAPMSFPAPPVVPADALLSTPPSFTRSLLP